MSGRLKLAMLILGAVVLSTFLVLVRNRDKTKTAQSEGREVHGQAGKAGTGEQAPDQAAFYGTYRITDPEEKLAALEKFVSDFPNSSQIGSAKREIFKAIVKKWPNDKKRILDAANRMIRPPEEAGAKTANIPEYQFIAKELLAAGILVDEAEGFALKSLEYFNNESFLESMKKMYAEWKRAMPSDDVMAKKYIQERAAYRATLGRIYLKKGKTTEGEKILKESHDADPLLSQAAMGLAEIAEKKGDNAAALDYLATATLTAGYTMREVRSRFEALYRKTHNGSLDGLEAMLDARYKKLFPNPIKVEQYKPTALRSNRVVLAEFFTGAG